MRALPFVLALTLALGVVSSAGAEPPPDADQGSTSLMTLMPILTPISDYTSDDWRTGACAFCFGACSTLLNRGVTLWHFLAPHGTTGPNQVFRIAKQHR
jgi:hypothetical protein